MAAAQRLAARAAGGVLPRRGERPVSVPEAGAGLDSGALAISREPEGGAPEGTPSEVLKVFPL